MGLRLPADFENVQDCQESRQIKVVAEYHGCKLRISEERSTCKARILVAIYAKIENRSRNERSWKPSCYAISMLLKRLSPFDLRLSSLISFFPQVLYVNPSLYPCVNPCLDPSVNPVHKFCARVPVYIPAPVPCTNPKHKSRGKSYAQIPCSNPLPG